MKWLMFCALLHIAASCPKNLDCRSCIAAKCSFYVTGDALECVPKNVKITDVRYKVPLKSKCNMAELFLTKSSHSKESSQSPTSTVEGTIAPLPHIVNRINASENKQQVKNDAISSTTILDKFPSNPTHATESATGEQRPHKPTSVVDLTIPNNKSVINVNLLLPADKTFESTRAKEFPQDETVLVRTKLNNIEPTKFNSTARSPHFIQ
ncbi:unnamed protein product [Orchesella dallaii]|uniref:Uncharacterized protein n=1 Tax=Orchesella dallaii TaxID=48710 RepID=A0ABP1RJP0_9HEXA